MSLDPADVTKNPGQLLGERDKRIRDAVALQKPDRVPLNIAAGYLLAEYGGISNQELQDDPEKRQALLERFALEFGPDNISGLVMHPAPSLALGDRMTAWPGHGLPTSGQFQFVEHEFMKVEDYPAFLRDPSDWAIRTYLPRAFEKLAGLRMLPPLGMWAFGVYGLDNLAFYSNPAVGEAVTALGEAIKAVGQNLGMMFGSIQRMAALGFPPPLIAGTIAEAPFDFMSDTLRGMRGIMLDMLRHPDELLAAEEKVLEIQLENVFTFANATGIRQAMFPLHRGSDGFMSLTQFERFYWPQLKRFFLALIDSGITPIVFFEGVWDKRLDYLAELPKGKVVGWFQKSDIFKVKEALGDVMCIIGGMPNSLLNGGSPEEVRELTKRLCERVGKNGGFIMSTSVGEMSGSKLENVRAWVDATREFGRYS
jgi:uroporphyrinogen-III decarboxylase